MIVNHNYCFYQAENAKKKINAQLHFLIHRMSRMLFGVEKLILGKMVEYGIVLDTHILQENCRFVRPHHIC